MWRFGECAKTQTIDSVKEGSKCLAIHGRGRRQHAQRPHRAKRDMVYPLRGTVSQETALRGQTFCGWRLECFERS